MNSLTLQNMSITGTLDSLLNKNLTYLDVSSNFIENEIPSKTIYPTTFLIQNNNLEVTGLFFYHFNVYF